MSEAVPTSVPVVLSEYEPESYERVVLGLTDHMDRSSSQDDLQVACEEAELRSVVLQAVAALPPRLSWVLRLRYGLDDGVERTLADVGAMLHRKGPKRVWHGIGWRPARLVGGEQIRHLEEEALGCLRKALAPYARARRRDARGIALERRWRMLAATSASVDPVTHGSGDRAPAASSAAREGLGGYAALREATEQLERRLREAARVDTDAFKAAMREQAKPIQKTFLRVLGSLSHEEVAVLVRQAQMGYVGRDFDVEDARGVAVGLGRMAARNLGLGEYLQAREAIEQWERHARSYTRWQALARG